MNTQQQPNWKLTIDQRAADAKLDWAKEEVMKLGNKLMAVLKEVHDSKAYRFRFKSFEDYCEKEWKITGSRAHQIISGENYRALLADAGCPQQIVESLKEGQLREVQSVPPVKMAKILTKLSKTGKITARRIQAEVLPAKAQLAERCKCPHCNGTGKIKPSDEIPE